MIGSLACFYVPITAFSLWRSASRLVELLFCREERIDSISPIYFNLMNGISLMNMEPLSPI